MKRFKFNKNKLLLAGGLLLATISVSAITLALVTSCSSSETTTTSKYTLKHSYNPSDDLKSLISEKQYNDMYNLFASFDGNNKLYAKVGPNNSLVLIQRDIKTNSFVVSGNKVEINLQFEMSSEGGQEPWGFCENIESWTLNPNNNPESLFTWNRIQLVNGVNNNPNNPTEQNASKSEFEQIISTYYLDNFEQKISSGVIKWEN